MKYPRAFLISLILLSLSASAIPDNDTTNGSVQMPQGATTGILKIITIPVDGAIYIDNNFTGSGLYYNTSFPAGIYRVSFGDVEGYESPKNQTVTVSEANQTNVIAQYTTFVITPPDVAITKESNSASIAADEVLDVIIKIKNNGNIKAFNVSLNDTIPECVTLENGDTAWSGELESGESRVLSYEVRPAKSGLCILSPARVVFGDFQGNRFSRFSDEVKVAISSKPANEPHLTVQKSVDKSTALVDEGVVITLKLINDGSAKAMNVNLTDMIPKCADISQGRSNWSGDLEREEEKVITYVLSFNTPGLCSLEAAKVSYSNQNGNNYLKYSEQLNIYVKEKSVSESLDTFVKPIVIIGTAIGSLVTIITVYITVRSKVSKKKEEK